MQLKVTTIVEMERTKRIVHANKTNFNAEMVGASKVDGVVVCWHD